MTLPSLRAGLAALAALGGLAAAAHAQQPAPAPAPQTSKVIQWPGGYLVMNGSEVIVRNSTPGRSLADRSIAAA